MATRPVILLDDGGVMNDNLLRGPQWQRLVGEFFAPRLGGSPEAWAEANRIQMTDLLEPENWQRRVRNAADYASFEHAYWCDWLNGMLQLLGIATPAEAACIELARQAGIYVTCRVQSAFPGAIAAIHALHLQGYTLHTASGESSLDLHGYLQAMGVREYFGHLYGPDLLNMPKESPTYYERLFTDAHLAPADALIVDDSPRVLAWARDLGATTVLVQAEGRSPDGMLCLASLAELPALLQNRYP